LEYKPNSGKLFIASISGQTAGSTFSYAFKFSCAGGKSVTKYLSYVVGNTCLTGVETLLEFRQSVYLNPAQTILHLQLAGERNHIILSDILGNRLFDGEVENLHTQDMSSYKTEIYFLRIENAKGIRFMKVVKA